MARRIRWLGVLLLLGILASLTLAEAGACERSRRTQRSLDRCARAVSTEGLSYTQRLNWQMERCLEPLARCSRIAPAKTWVCGVAMNVCVAVPDAETELAERLRSRIVSACEGLTPKGLLDDLGFGSQVGDCEVDSLEAFADCFATALRGASAALLVDLHPNACHLVEEAELSDVLPVDVCASRANSSDDPGGPVEPVGPLFCGGPDDLSCPEGFACDRQDPLCTLSHVAGLCVPADGDCHDDGTPVCGCDGVSYGSDCQRLGAGVTARHDGPCDPSPTSCEFDTDCPEGLFCEYPTGDCGEGLSGVCRSMRAEPCNLCAAFVEAPVCGCNWTTYASDCERRAAGVAKWFDGACF